MDRTDFTRLYNETIHPLRRYALRMLGDAAAAEDVVQEAYVRSLAHGSLPPGPDAARAYLFRVTSNLIVDHWRRLKRERSHAETTPEQAASIQSQEGLDLAKLFAGLSLRERQLIWLAHVEEEDHRTIAQMLGLRHGSVKVLLHRARKSFADRLRAGGYHERGESQP